MSSGFCKDLEFLNKSERSVTSCDERCPRREVELALCATSPAKESAERFETRVIYESPDKSYRIIEEFDELAEMDEMRGELPEATLSGNSEIGFSNTDEFSFESQIVATGIFGYRLERANVGGKSNWILMDSCYGFVGRYSETNMTAHKFIEGLKKVILKDSEIIFETTKSFLCLVPCVGA